MIAEELRSKNNCVWYTYCVYVCVLDGKLEWLLWFIVWVAQLPRTQFPLSIFHLGGTDNFKKSANEANTVKRWTLGFSKLKLLWPFVYWSIKRVLIILMPFWHLVKLIMHEIGKEISKRDCFGGLSLVFTGWGCRTDIECLSHRFLKKWDFVWITWCFNHKGLVFVKKFWYQRVSLKIATVQEISTYPYSICLCEKHR